MALVCLRYLLSITLCGISVVRRPDYRFICCSAVRPGTGFVSIMVSVAEAEKNSAIVHNGFMTSVNPTLGRTDFSVLDVNLTLLADASNDVWEILHES